MPRAVANDAKRATANNRENNPNPVNHLTRSAMRNCFAEQWNSVPNNNPAKTTAGEEIVRRSVDRVEGFREADAGGEQLSRFQMFKGGFMAIVPSGLCHLPVHHAARERASIIQIASV